MIVAGCPPGPANAEGWTLLSVTLKYCALVKYQVFSFSLESLPYSAEVYCEAVGTMMELQEDSLTGQK